MAKVLIIYYSQTNNTKKMANFVEEGARKENIEVICKSLDNTNLNDLLRADGIIIGSPTHFGAMSAPIKEFIDKSIKCYGKFEGKVGGAFTSCHRIGGGGETALQSIINAFLVHGMIIQGESKGSHYGPVAIGPPDDTACEECRKLGKKVACLVKKLFTSTEW